jgi:hypothetical protein
MDFSIELKDPNEENKKDLTEEKDNVKDILQLQTKGDRLKKIFSQIQVRQNSMLSN